jgi:hypothetical protein
MKKFKYELGDKVFLLGRAGICAVSGRGRLDFLSGGNLNMYQVNGAHHAYVAEHELLTVQELKTLTEA